VSTCLVHNCETSRGLLDFYLLSPLFQDQIPFDPHQRSEDIERVLEQIPIKNPLL